MGLTATLWCAFTIELGRFLVGQVHKSNEMTRRGLPGWSLENFSAGESESELVECRFNAHAPTGWRQAWKLSSRAAFAVRSTSSIWIWQPRRHHYGSGRVLICSIGSPPNFSRLSVPCSQAKYTESCKFCRQNSVISAPRSSLRSRTGR